MPALYSTHLFIRDLIFFMPFQKKSKKGIATPKKDVDLIARRYKEVLEMKK
jgi:phage-related protein